MPKLPAVAMAALLLPSCASSLHRPQVAITVDDLPVHSPYPPGATPLGVSRQMIAALKAGHVPATGFVNGVNAKDADTMQVLREWRAAGFLLGNHTWSHPHLSEISAGQFEQEVTRNEPILAEVGAGSDWRWFRYPFLDEGKDEAQRAVGREVLANHGYRVADVTTTFSDWAFTGAWARCNEAGDKAAVARLERMYLDDVKESIRVARVTARALYGREYPYVLLMHVSAMSAQLMPQVIKLYRDSGFRFVSLPRAESDPVYRPDIDLSLPGRKPDWKLADERRVTIPSFNDPKLEAICPRSAAAKNR